ncbi:MAG: FGGY-family carbohydrate kinase, partial [Gammaproteobacteria bacterium]|nr:FGGY-family carbohydrate kinase [Gammaproteobacteria bacterium]
MSLYIGIDIGTSGCRAIAIDSDGQVRHQAHTPLPTPHRSHTKIEQDPELWWHAVMETLTAVLQDVDTETVVSIAIDGTSGTTLLADSEGQPLTTALMYNDARATAEAAHIAQHAPRESAAHGTSSGLSKLLWLLKHEGLLKNTDGHAAKVHTQADWITGRLTGRFGISDINNALKLGFDPISGQWPGWLQALGIPKQLLPEIVEPGSAIGHLKPEVCAKLGLPESVMVIAGTTDSTAAFIATGASEVGEAVTSLGSTLVTKVIADQPVFAPEYGVYSQPLGEHWLVGGGSNSGGAVLRHYFSDAQMRQMTSQLNPDKLTGLDYYPLRSKGERFPTNDPELESRLTPRPATQVEFFQAMLEGIA